LSTTDLKLLAYLEGFLTDDRKQRFHEILAKRTNYITVVMEDVFQMHNTSAVIRSCDVFGIQQAHVIESRFGKRLDKNIAMGAQQWVDVHRHENATLCMQHLRTEGYKLIGTTPNSDSCSLQDFDLTTKTAFFFGTERDGLSSEIIDAVDGNLKIPMVGFSESLNISVAAAIILQTLTDQLRQKDIPWSLSAEEKLNKRLDWCKKSIKSIDAILDRYSKTQ